MASDNRLIHPRFPRSAQYHPDWILNGAFGGSALWLAEWLTASMDLQPGMRVLDLGCGRGHSSIFLACEFGVEVWATDLWCSATEIMQRARDADLEARVRPIHADAHSLPYAAEYFDAIVSIDAYSYFGTDGLYLNYLANFVRPGGQIGIAGAGLAREFEAGVPEHLRKFWTQDCWGLHSAEWWRQHWQRTGIVDVKIADLMPDGWQVWLDWQRTAYPNNKTEFETLEADRGEYLGYVRAIACLRPDVRLEAYCWPDNLKSMPPSYQRHPLLRDDATNG